MKEYIVKFKNSLVFSEIMDLKIYPSQSYLSIISPKVIVVGSENNNISVSGVEAEVLDGSIGENWNSVFFHLYDAKIKKNFTNHIIVVSCKGQRNAIEHCNNCTKYNHCKMQKEFSMMTEVVNGTASFYETIGTHNSYVFTFSKKNAA